MSKFKIEFYRDKEQDKNDTYEFFKDSDPAGWIDRAISCGMPVFLVEGIVNKKDDAKEVLFDFMDREYEVFTKNELYSFAEEETNKLWNNISDEFSERVEYLTERKLDNYKCLLSLYLTTSAWDEEVNIRRNIKQLWNEKSVVAVEVLLSHCFKCVRDFYSYEDIKSDWDVWGFAEITSSFLIRDKVINKMFPDENQKLEESFFENTMYPHLIQPEEDLKKFWIERKSFKEYLDKSIEYLKKNHIEF